MGCVVEVLHHPGHTEHHHLWDTTPTNLPYCINNINASAGLSASWSNREQVGSCMHNSCLKLKVNSRSSDDSMTVVSLWKRSSEWINLNSISINLDRRWFQAKSNYIFLLKCVYSTGVIPFICVNIMSPTATASLNIDSGVGITPVEMLRRLVYKLKGFRSCGYWSTVNVPFQWHACLAAVISLFCSLCCS